MLTEEAEWIKTLPNTSPTFKSSLAKEILKQSTSKRDLAKERLKHLPPRSSEGSILKFVRKRKKAQIH